MNDVVGLIDEELKTALENISGKKINGTFQTTAEMLHAFNDLYTCKVTFDVVDSKAAPVTGATITVKSGDTVITPGADGKYTLEAGSYTYDCVADGYTDITGTSFTIAATDITRGTKSITVTMTATA